MLTYNIYNVNDTLFFRNKVNDLDTFVISSKTIVNKGWDENTGWYNPPVANVTFKDLPKNNYGLTVIRWATSDTIVQDCSIIGISKRSPGSEIKETIGFKGFIGDIDRKKQKTNEFDTNIFGVIYKVPSFDMTTVSDLTEITHIYWSDKFGIIAYDLKNGDRWNLILK
ncbi:MAG: hypothetical protein K1X81_11200 [Bacteroidia bacterium]|nr:hypothetical protein [Bacteroidia bacterium]